jgi:Flp pilus assembly protein TadG
MRSPLSLRKNDRGATMLEFSLVAFPILMLLAGTVEIGFIYWGTKELENATGTGARFVRTGIAQQGNWSSSDLKVEICRRTSLLYDCASKLRIDVVSAATFAAFAPVAPLDASGNLLSDASFSYAPGGRNDVVLVRTFYPWTRLLGGTHIMRAAVPVRNEPF